jgi:arylsulfatase A
LEQNTIVVFTSDNGTDNVIEAATIRSRFIGREVRGGKYFPTELGINVPMIVRWPGRIATSSASKELVDFTDVMPTLAELAGAKLPPDYFLDGRSFVPTLLGRARPAKEFIYSYGNFEQSSKKYKEPQRFPKQWLHVVRDGRWKYYSDGRLFDLRNDFLETAPIAPGTRPEADAALARLKGQLESLRKTQPRVW